MGLGPRIAAGQLEVNHFEVFLTATNSRGTFIVTNTSNEAVTSRLTVGDWERAVDGTNHYTDTAGTLKGSCHPNITVFPSTLLLAPQQSQTVQVTYTGGARTTSCWSIVFVGTAPQPANIAGGARVTVELRQGIKVYVEPPGARPELQVDSVDTIHHVPAPNEPPRDTVGFDISAMVHNPGLIQSRVKGHIEYRTIKDSLVAQRAIDEFPILPGAQRRVRSRLPQLRPGHYVVLVVFDFGGPELVAGQLELDVK